MRKDKKGFTLIELLAVIIILGILMLVAVPSVSAYITNSRKSSYVSTAKAIMKGTITLANDGSLDLTDTDTTYFIPATCVDVDNTTKSPYGDFVKAYTAVGFDGESFSYYWTSVDDVGIGVPTLVAFDKIETKDVVENLTPESVSTETGIGRKKKVVVYNADCSSKTASSVKVNINFDANGGVFPNGQTTNTISVDAVSNNSSTTYTKYSHTQNISDDGTKNSDYLDNWTNANITGTERGSTSQAHVITIPGAESLHVTITYGGETKQYDWTCVWQGAHPDYAPNTSTSDCGTSNVVGGGKIGPNNSSDGMNTVEFDVPGDSVTFGYRSDTSQNGNNNASKGYGYYAVVTAEVTGGYTGNYMIPEKENSVFAGWIDSQTGASCNSFSCILSSNGSNYQATYNGISTLVVNAPNSTIKINNVSTNIGSNGMPQYQGTSGTTLTYGNPSKGGGTNYLSESWVVSFNSDGGDTTPANKYSQKRRNVSRTFDRYEFTGSCGTYTSTTSNGTYTFPEGTGGICTLNVYFNESYTNLSGAAITLPAAPTKEGFTFAGWKSSIDNQIYDAGASYSPTSDATMTAQWT